MKVLLLGRVNAGRDMCVGKLHLLIFTWKTWPMSRSLNSTPGPLLRRLFTYHSFQLEEQRNAKNVPKFSFKSALALYALRTCRWPRKARLVCGLALARPQWVMIDVTIKCTNVASHLQISNFVLEYSCSFYFYFYFICHCIDRPTDQK